MGNRITPYFSLEQDQRIRQIVQDCGRKVRNLAAEQLEVFQKGPNDYVTNVDRELDRYLSNAFQSLFPEDGIVTEENAQSRDAFFRNVDRLWVIDPLDGTEDFIQGKAEYSVMVGLLQASRPIAGWIYAPVTDQMYFGSPQSGLFKTTGDALPQSLQPTQPPALSREFCPVMIGTRDQKNFGLALSQAIPGIQFSSLGSFGLKVMEVILGRAGLYLYLNGRVKVWDTAGPLALAQTAGLVCCDLAGEPISFLPEALNLETLSHKQAILVGWPTYMEPLLPKIRQVATLALPDSHNPT
ncbi:3'-phosphoadenosine 5'-phosphosulfate 3'-phosphatase [Leptolyngbya sp. 'hensonii']|uniref:3'(2'),5'-bisphosphate nucleotidase CysQ family protein n=1 Tax=Leptolyngbya sp. 'hensonii' TaxID=1922337 RepID=UPI00094F754D|nr:inositol monophosphatase family protein [Leptolyngbya sp. 'hensonii']OLP16453.1 3'-phosphoadenosine 5'-phosphosulfate 3'-phosphatase [Leptolyngbya sp. 'hensonii']